MTTPLRIAVAASGLGDIAPGIEPWAGDLGNALAERGHDVRLDQGGGASIVRQNLACDTDVLADRP